MEEYVITIFGSLDELKEIYREISSEHKYKLSKDELKKLDEIISDLYYEPFSEVVVRTLEEYFNLLKMIDKITDGYCKIKNAGTVIYLD